MYNFVKITFYKLVNIKKHKHIEKELISRYHNNNCIKINICNTFLYEKINYIL